VQRAVVAQLLRALVPGGWLVVGAVEASAELLRPLVPVTFPGAILFRKAPTAVDMLPGSIPILPLGEALHAQERRSTPSPWRSPPPSPSPVKGEGTRESPRSNRTRPRCCNRLGLWPTRAAWSQLVTSA